MARYNAELYFLKRREEEMKMKIKSLEKQREDRRLYDSAFIRDAPDTFQTTSRLPRRRTSSAKHSTPKLLSKRGSEMRCTSAMTGCYVKKYPGTYGETKRNLATERQQTKISSTRLPAGERQRPSLSNMGGLMLMGQRMPVCNRIEAEKRTVLQPRPKTTKNAMTYPNRPWY